MPKFEFSQVIRLEFLQNAFILQRTVGGKILQTLSEESISPMDPNNIERNCSTISFVLPRVRVHARPHQLESLRSVNPLYG